MIGLKDDDGGQVEESQQLEVLGQVVGLSIQLVEQWVEICEWSVVLFELEATEPGLQFVVLE